MNIIADASVLELRVPFSLRQKTFPSLFVWFGQLNQTHIQSVLFETNNGGYRTEEIVGSQITYCIKSFVKKSGKNFSHSLTKLYQFLPKKSSYFQYFFIRNPLVMLRL